MSTVADTRIQLEHLLEAAMEARLAVLHVSLPCKVDSYNASKNTVNLVPLLKRKRRSTKDGSTTSSQIASLQNVPVAFLRSSKAWVTIPVSKGDVGMVVFAERSLKDWMGKNKGEVVEPVDETKHPLDGAWFYPGGYPSASPINPTNADHPVFHTETELHLGESGLTANDFVAIGKLVDDRLSTIQSTFDTHQHPSGMGPTGPPTNLFVSFASVKATKVKAK